MSKLRVLLISNFFFGEKDSALLNIFEEGIFAEKYQTVVVYFSRSVNKAVKKDNACIVPYRARKKSLLKELSSLFSLESFSHILVRNLFPVLKQCIPFCKEKGIPVGFWESFPHSYRHLYQAKEQKRRGLFLRHLNWLYKNSRENKLLEQCDFYLPISETLKKDFRESLSTPFLPLGMGIEESFLKKELLFKKEKKEGPLRFVYIGSFDPLRKGKELVEAFLPFEKECELHIYTKSSEDTIAFVKGLDCSHIYVHDALQRSEILKRLSMYDIGLSPVPNTTLFRQCVPTKTFEYYAAGLPAIISPLPEHLRVMGGLSSKACFFAEMETSLLKAAIKKALACSRKELGEMAKAGRQHLLSDTYEQLASKTEEFLLNL